MWSKEPTSHSLTCHNSCHSHSFFFQVDGLLLTLSIACLLFLTLHSIYHMGWYDYTILKACGHKCHFCNYITCYSSYIEKLQKQKHLSIYEACSTCSFLALFMWHKSWNLWNWSCKIKKGKWKFTEHITFTKMLIFS